jgi:hypothetical protein
LDGVNPLDWKSQKVPDPGCDLLGEMNWPHNDIVAPHDDWSKDAVNPSIECESPLDWEPEESERNQKDAPNHCSDSFNCSYVRIIVVS